MKDLKDYGPGVQDQCAEEDLQRHKAMCEKAESPGLQTDKRKAELFQLAQSIVAQVKVMSHRRERCFLNNLVQLLLDN